MTTWHAGRPPAPHDLWAMWSPDPMLAAGLLAVVVVYWRGLRIHRRPAPTARPWYFGGGLLAVGVALLSPLDELSGALASAHMVQHLLLVLVAAPLVALGSPVHTLMLGVPLRVRRSAARWRGRLRLTRTSARALRHPAAVWLLYVGTLWFWHASVPYDASLEREPVHVLEHATLLLTAVLLWTVIVESARSPRASPGVGILVSFATAMQGAFLSVLLTFAETPWYGGYASTTRAWGVDPLTDQQLAGVIMWVPGGVVYLAAALVLLGCWIRRSEGAEVVSGPRVGHSGRGSRS